MRIPSGFFKIICYKAKEAIDGNFLGVKAFAMFQDEEILNDLKGRRSIKYKEYQVTIKEIQERTGLILEKNCLTLIRFFIFIMKSLEKI